MDGIGKCLAGGSKKTKVFMKRDIIGAVHVHNTIREEEDTGRGRGETLVSNTNSRFHKLCDERRAECAGYQRKRKREGLL